MQFAWAADASTHTHARGGDLEKGEERKRINVSMSVYNFKANTAECVVKKLISKCRKNTEAGSKSSYLLYIPRQKAATQDA